MPAELWPVSISRTKPINALVRAEAVRIQRPDVTVVRAGRSQHAPDYRREDLISKLKKMGGGHLVIVCY